MSVPWRRTGVIKTAKIPLAITHAAAELDILSLEDSPARVSKKKPPDIIYTSCENNFIPDIDECALGIDVCYQTCADTEGSYTCRCQLGYTLDADGRSCNGIMRSKFYGKA